MTTTIDVRPATAADTHLLVEFNRAMAAESEDRGLDVATLTRGVEYLLANPAEGFYLIAERDGQVAGSLMVTYEWSDWRCGRFWWIQSVYVLPEQRRFGVYSEMHDTVRKRAQEDPQGCGLRLYVEQDNAGAMATYRSLDMAETHYRLYEEEFGPAR
ncbi:MAG: GNAT family N-acetyltransferase [Pseudomonadales bacterium]